MFKYLLRLFGASFIGMFFASLAAIGIFSLYYDGVSRGDLIAIAKNYPHHLNPVRWAQIINTIFVFLIPAILYRISKPVTITKTSLQIKKIYLLAPVLLISSYVMVEWLYQLNRQLAFPESLQSIEVWMKNYEQQTKTIILALLDTTSVGLLLFNLLTIALIPAIAEEYFFRKGLQHILIRKWSPAAAIIVSAIIFSAFHMDFYGFLPRLFLGLLLGYAYYATGRIRVSIWMHFFNNAMQVILIYIQKVKGMNINIEENIYTSTPQIAIGAIIFLTALFLFHQIAYREKVALAE